MVFPLWEFGNGSVMENNIIIIIRNQYGSQNNFYRSWKQGSSTYQIHKYVFIRSYILVSAI